MSARAALGASPRPVREGTSPVRAIIRGITARRLAVAESIGVFIILMRYVEAGGRLTLADAPVLAVELLSLVPVLLLLAALTADQFVIAGASAGRSYSLCVLVAASLGAILQCAAQTWVRAHLASHPATVVLHPWSRFASDMIDILLPGGVAMLVFHSRRSAVRILNRLRTAELSRLQLEQHLNDSRLAAAQTQMDSAAILSFLKEMGAHYRTAPQDADIRFDNFVESLQMQRLALRRMGSVPK